MLSRQGVERINSLQSTLRIPTVLEFAGFYIHSAFVVTDRSSIADESKPQEYYEQVQVLENYEELEIARGSAYYALFAQMQKMAEEN